MLKYAVRAALRGRLFRSFLICMIPTLLPWVMQLIPLNNTYVDLGGILRFSPLSLLLALVAALFVTEPLYVRVAGYFLALNRSPESLPPALSIFDCFGEGYWRLVRALGLKMLMTGSWLVAPLISALPALSMPGVLTGAAAWWVPALLWAVVALCCWRQLVYFPMPYLLYDNPNPGAWEALRESREITRGRVGELFLMYASFTGWLLVISLMPGLVAAFMGLALAVLAPVLAAIFVMPYIEGTAAGFYLAYTHHDENEA